MAEATVSHRFKGSLGSINVEFIAVSAPTTGDTVETTLSNPKGGGVMAGSASNDVVNMSGSFSGKTFTFGTLSGSIDALVLVYGF